MEESKEILDTDIQEWIKSYDYHIDSDSCSELAEKISLEVANSLLLSVIKKVGAIEGVNKANEILKSKLGINTEIEIGSLIKEINNLSELELKLVALRTCDLSTDTKQKILNGYIQGIAPLMEKKQTTVTDLLKEQIERVYKNLGELPSNNINDVKLVKDQKKPLATRPFGRKKNK